jgi:hypothetical protein
LAADGLRQERETAEQQSLTDDGDEQPDIHRVADELGGVDSR